MVIYAIVDDNGFFIEDKLVSKGTNVPSNHIASRPDTQKKGYYRARWTGAEWVEGMTQEELEELTLLEDLKPSQEEIDNADFEIKTITLLSKLGVL